MRLAAVLLALALVAVAAAWLSSGPVERPRAEEAGAAHEPGPGPAAARATEGPPVPTTGKLVVRVRTSDGSAVPPETRAGYVHYGASRLRRAAPDGTFPFLDAPVGRLEATADAPGYTADRVAAVVVAGVDGAEPVVTLTPVK